MRASGERVHTGDQATLSAVYSLKTPIETRMRSIHLIAILSLAAVAGCRDATGPTDGSAPARISLASLLIISTHVSSATLQPPTPITITVTYANISRKPATVHWAGCSAMFAVRSHEGFSVTPPYPNGVCSEVLETRTLQPGESVSFSRSWNGGDVVGGDGAGQVPPGDYFVSGNGFNGPVRSNPAVKVTVLP